jgi:RND family efflux transporter MFP subunit
MAKLSEKGSVAKSELDAAEARLKRAKASVSAQRAAVQAGEAALKETEVVLEYTNMRAPFDAVVLTKNADIGDIVTPLGAAANAKAAVVDIADMGSLQVEVDVSESNIDLVKKGQPCEIRLDALQDSRFRGKVHMVVPTADRSKASVMVKVAFIEKDSRILPEMSAKVAFLSREIGPEERKPFKAVPAGSVIGKGEARHVYSVENGRASKTFVKTGREAGDVAELISGPETGALLITGPLDKVKDGMKVKILEE